MNKREVVETALYAAGWDMLSGPDTAVASTEYGTCVGIKKAHAYLEGNVLNFDYQSEGRNICEPLGLIIPELTEDTYHSVYRAIKARAERVHECVMQSYGVRMASAE
jgi:hypothetical protein